jgi:hypothetical protein
MESSSSWAKNFPPINELRKALHIAREARGEGLLLRARSLPGEPQGSKKMAMAARA